MKILGIETSCDETAASVVEGNKEEVKVLSNIVSSQIEIHKEWGGVVPEVAAREHVGNILPVIDEALKRAGIKRDSSSEDGIRMTDCIDAIAVAVGPGLITSLQTGVETAKVLSYALNIAAIPVNHIEGHIYSNFISIGQKIEFPAVVLTVSGGHTMLILMEGYGKLKLLGETRDDAAGEAFDKAAKLMNIGYPGGPIISEYAEKFKPHSSQFGVAKISNLKTSHLSPLTSLPRPMINSDNYEFSFSGLKTALRYALEKDPEWKNKIPEYCHEFQQAAIDVLISKAIKATIEFKAKTIMLSGGVSANTELRKQLGERIEKKLPDVKYKIPDLAYTTDNAAMIATAGYFKYKLKKIVPWQKLKTDSNLEL